MLPDPTEQPAQAEHWGTPAAHAAEEGPPNPPEHRPIVAPLLCAACILLTLGVFSELEGDASWDKLSRFGYYPTSALWEGKYWLLFTSTFIHVDFIHLIFNVYWLWHLGRLLEGYLGPVLMILFYVGSSIVSSGIQLAVSGEVGVGASGVVYSIFGFMWVSSRFVPAFRQRMTSGTINLFIVWLGLCLVLTQLDVWRIGNAAHIGGMLSGVFLGMSFRPAWRRPARAGLISLTLASILPLFWCPMSWEWCARRATSAYLAEDWSRAIYYYERSLKRGADPTWVWVSLAQTYRVAKRMDEYNRAIEMLRGIDPSAVVELEQEFAATSEPSVEEE